VNTDIQKEKSEKFFTGALIAAVVLSLIPWFIVQFRQSVNADNAWLTIAAMRFLSGDAMSGGFYDPNPPLSILAQIVPALLTKYAHVPLYYAVFFYSLFLVALSSWAVNKLAAASGVFGRSERHLLIAGYVLCNTLLAGQYLGEREQYILLGLFPFVLVQAGITLNWPLPRRTSIAVLIAGSVAVLIKPYYGLIPAVLLAHRMIRQRRASVVLDADCRALVAATAIYLLTVALVFPDYIRVILPDVLNLYVPVRASMVMPIAVCLGLLCLLLASLSVLLPGPAGKSNAGLFGLAALCVIPFFIQGKGYFYHAFPALVFFSCGLLLLTCQAVAPAVKKHIATLAPALPAAVFVLFAAMSYAALPPNASYPTHDDYRKSDPAGIIRSCGDPCPFFLFNDMSEMISPLAVYTRQTHASRFPSFWFLPPLVRAQYALDHGQPAAFTRNQIAAYRKKYSAMVTADFRKYNPRLLLIGQFDIAAQDHPFDFAGWLSADPGFSEVWRRYQFVKDVSVNRSLFFGGTIYALKDNTVTYKIYRKRDR